jgi:voltage-gated potassium channel
MFDLIVAGILSIDFYARAKESKQRGRFIAKHSYEIPAIIPLLVFGIFESQSVFNVVIRGLIDSALQANSVDFQNFLHSRKHWQ